MPNLYLDLATAKDELRRARDHESTMRSIAELIELSGKSVDDRKRELAFALSQHDGWRKAQDDLRAAEYAVDQCQAAIDQAEAELRKREWNIRARLAEALLKERVAHEDAVPDWLADRRLVGRAKAQAEMDELYT